MTKRRESNDYQVRGRRKKKTKREPKNKKRSKGIRNLKLTDQKSV
jgi:hypothetical protein